VAEPSGNPPDPPHAARTTHAAKTPPASDKMDAPAACVTLSATTPFHFLNTAGGVVTRTRNVSDYMLVLAVWLVHIYRICRRQAAAVIITQRPASDWQQLMKMSIEDRRQRHVTTAVSVCSQHNASTAAAAS